MPSKRHSDWIVTDIPPVLDQVIESMAGCSCYTILDLFVGYDHCTLDILSHNLTTIQSVTPLDCYLTDCRTVPVYDKDWDYLIAKIR